MPSVVLHRYAAALSLIAAASLLAGFGSKALWLCDLFANLRLHIAAGLLLLLPVHVLFRQRALAVLATLGIALSGLTFAAAERPDRNAPATPGTDLVITSLNLGHGFHGRTDVVDYLNTVNADILVLVEYSPDWHTHFAATLTNYPYVIAEPRSNAFGIAVYSREPLANAGVEVFPGGNIPYIRGTASTAAGPLDLLALHLQWPMTPASFSQRNRQIERVVALAQASDPPLVACGDWNMTPWSGWYRHILAGGLQDGARADSLSPTWPARLGSVGISIDHCFGSEGVSVSQRRTGPSLGPDHRPISVRVRRLPR